MVLFKKTKIQVGNPNKATTAVRVVMVNPLDSEMEKRIQAIFKSIYPELTEGDEDFDELVETIRLKSTGQVKQ